MIILSTSPKVVMNSEHKKNELTHAIEFLGVASRFHPVDGFGKPHIEEAAETPLSKLTFDDVLISPL